MSGPASFEPAVPLLLGAVARPPRLAPPRRPHRGNAVDLCFDKVVRQCSSFVIACEACDTKDRGNIFCLADLTAEEMMARQTQRLPLEVRKSIAFLRIWVRAARPPRRLEAPTHRTPAAPRSLHRPRVTPPAPAPPCCPPRSAWRR